MIEPHPMLDIAVPVKVIETAADREGYDLYIPETFFKHLMCAFSYYKITDNPLDCIAIKNEYTKQFEKVINMIDFDAVRTNNPVIFAIRVLKLISRRVNLRTLEQCSKVGLTFKLDDNLYQNYKFDLRTLSPAQLQAMDIKANETETIVLSDEAKSILNFYDGISVLEQTLDPQYNVISKQITSYSDFHKGKRYKLSLPTFGVDLGTKKLQITKVDHEDMFASEVILAIDCSLSMKKEKFSSALIRSALLYYIGKLETQTNLTITLLYIIGEIDSIQHVTKVEQLQTIFKFLPDFLLPVKSAANLFHDIGTLYPGRSVVFLSDGRLNLKTMLNLKYKLYSIVLNPNDILRQTCLLSGGQLIVLK